MTKGPLVAQVPYAEGLAEILVAGGYRVRLEVQRADGAPLTDEERQAIALAVESYQVPSEHTDDELAEAVELASRQPLTASEATPLATIVAVPSALASSFASVGLAAHLVVQRQDGRLLTTNDQAAAQVMVECYEIESEREVSDDEVAEAALRALGAGASRSPTDPRGS